MSSMILDTAEKIFTRNANVLSPGTFDVVHWTEVEASGFTLALLAEEAGGFGLSAGDATSILRVSAKHASRLPLAETMLANWLLADSGLPIANGVTTIALVDALPSENCRSVVATRVPWARASGAVVVVALDGRIGSFDSPRIVAHGMNFAGEARDDIELVWSEEISKAKAPRRFETYLALCALLRVIGLAGSAEAALKLSVEYANDRVQFGRPIGRNQVIQHQLAIMASHVAASTAAADMAATAFPLVLTDEDRFKTIVASAKIRAGEAAGICASIAHQVHGAIGITEEYRLHNLTKQLWSWRDEYGNEAFWSEVLADQMLSMKTPSPWQFLSREAVHVD
ncbi:MULTISPECIES: acyl-CoA dehydrogenase family protein [unclassified Mesorhizobium]|uniref:acyl-CoA dehydrogenase family protein n=1 Tax=unclassified Mesorhizobium TaxID=325217 RepID=UPI0015E2C7E2|nr:MULTISPECIES: acyl-CoA dehydrogenase family protein [unclassified Mesorhizobium]